jgi:hypothetical protein
MTPAFNKLYRDHISKPYPAHGCANTQVDPNFNIYEAALPWAIQRAISPSTPQGAATLRSTLLTKENEVQWQRFEQLIADATKSNAPTSPKSAAPKSPGALPLGAGAGGDAAGSDSSAGSTGGGGAAKAKASVVGRITPMDSLKTVMSAPEGKSLRRIARDVDSQALLMRLVSPSSRNMRRLAVDAIASAIATQETEVNKAAATWPLRCRPKPEALNPTPACRPQPRVRHTHKPDT